MAGERCPHCSRPVGRDGRCRFCAAPSGTADPPARDRQAGMAPVLGAAGLVVAVLIGLVLWRAGEPSVRVGAAGTPVPQLPATSQVQSAPSAPVEADQRRREYPRMLPDGGSTTVAPSPTTPAPPTTNADVTVPAAGTMLTVGVQSLPHGSNPLLVTAPDAVLVLHQIFDGLTSYAPDGRTVQTDLARSWSAAADYADWTLRLDPGRRFSDGTPVTAAAVCANVIRWSTLPPSQRDAGFYWQVYFGDFAGSSGGYLGRCTAPTSTEVRLAFTRPIRALPAVLALPYFAIAAPDSFDGDVPVGSGPYRWSQADSDTAADTVTLDYNPLSGQSAKVARLVFRNMSGTSSDALGALRSGVIDMYGPIDGAAVPAADSGVQVVPRPASTVLMLGMNQAAGRPLSRSGLREAIGAAVDTAALAGLAGPGARATGSLLPPVVSGSVGAPTPPDVATAKELVAAVPAAARSLVFLVRHFPAATADSTYADAIVGQLRAVGFTVSVRAADSADQYYQLLRSGAADLFISPFWPDTNDADDLITGLVTSQSDVLGIAHAGWYPDFVAELDRANLQPGTTRRADDLQRLARQLVEQYRVGVPLLLTTSSWLLRSAVTGLQASPLRLERLTGVSAG